jgi:hypothetical protein
MQFVPLISEMMRIRVFGDVLFFCYAAFFCPARTFAHLARCAAAILFLPAIEIVLLRFGA